MRPLALPTGITILQKTSFKNGFDDITQSMVDHPISKRSGTNHPNLFIPNKKRSITARPVGVRPQLVVQNQQFFFNIQTKRTDI